MTRILVVEDDSSSRIALVELLADEGYSVIEAATGLEAIALAQHHAPDIAIVDVGLPDMSGTDLMRHLEPSCQVILVTGSAEIEEGPNGVRFINHADRLDEIDGPKCLSKPIDFAELLAIVRRIAQGG